MYTNTIEIDRINLEHAIRDAENNEAWSKFCFPVEWNFIFLGEFLPALLEKRQTDGNHAEDREDDDHSEDSEEELGLAYILPQPFNINA